MNKRSVQLTITELGEHFNSKNISVYHLDAPDNALNFIKKLIESIDSIPSANMIDTNTNDTIWNYYEQTKTVPDSIF